MKPNLKDFPITAILDYVKKGDIEEVEKQVFAILDWRERFEKKLIDPINYLILPKGTEIHHVTGETSICNRKLVVVEIKEILGE